MDIVITPIREDHAASYRECLDVVAREKRYLGLTQALPLAQTEAFVRDNVRSDAIQFVALEGERVVGWADIFPHWAQALAHCAGLGMGVHPDYRRRCIGRQLLQACIAKAWRKGVTRIELEARADNAHAIALYRQLGFEHEAVKRHGMRFDGVYFDTVLMRLLAPESFGESGLARSPHAG
ncbi:MAG: GNAT family N-acetyltransferase [Rubrivivax sp.]|nr:GNAT family N-acetyltransferase [Rubrivivax sp.]